MREDGNGAVIMRCPYCNTLIIHKFSGRYNRMDRKRKDRHLKQCEENPRNEDPVITMDAKDRYYKQVTGKGVDEITEGKRRLSVLHNWREENNIYKEKWYNE